MSTKQALEIVIKDLEKEHKALSETIKTSNKTPMYYFVKHECNMMQGTLNFLKARHKNLSV